jgi:hypothetical protein
MMDQNQTFLFLVLMTRLRISKLYAMMLKVFIRELQEMIWFWSKEPPLSRLNNGFFFWEEPNTIYLYKLWFLRKIEKE